MSDDILRNAEGKPTGFVRRAVGEVPRELAPKPARDDIDDFDRQDFLALLNGPDAPDLSDWEAGFVKDNLHRCHFTDNQRLAIDRMIEKYGRNLRGW